MLNYTIGGFHSGKLDRCSIRRTANFKSAAFGRALEADVAAWDDGLLPVRSGKAGGRRFGRDTRQKALTAAGHGAEPGDGGGSVPNVERRSRRVPSFYCRLTRRSRRRSTRRCRRHSSIKATAAALSR